MSALVTELMANWISAGDIRELIPEPKWTKGRVWSIGAVGGWSCTGDEAWTVTLVSAEGWSATSRAYLFI